MSSSPTSSSSTEPFGDLVGALGDVLCSVSVQLGSGRITLRDLLALERDSIVRLTQAAGEDLLITVHGTPLALGEVVIIDDSTALRVTQICQPTAESEAA
jgi:flagellar motor switch protein FliN/FliY